ncbi:MAG TPA: cysteine--1-D-myo-inosityl 2-amino-2-deoxy-alpha-D-glucopyranoside ligase, partial [Geodermatophilus sp.]|nr:cysteine--1-D-myo-inosityl 2-amino-2-deoxy-alpha-D-glucopyranoside ligase [Geodermatophilus sp.]
PVLAGLRERLADDLDTPGAIAVVDAWAAATLGGDGDTGDGDTEDGASCIVADAVDALLGVLLQEG